MRAAVLSTLLVICVLPQALAAPKPLAQVLGAACYTRTYDQAHLDRHPRQRVTAIHVRDSVVPAGEIAGIAAIVDIRLQLRGGAKAEAVGYCKRTGDTLACSLEGDAGALTLSRMSSGDLHVAVDGRFDVETERSFIALAKGDDRQFVLRASTACQ